MSHSVFAQVNVIKKRIHMELKACQVYYIAPMFKFLAKIFV